MKYITSNNLKNKYKLKNHMYKLLPPYEDEDESDIDNYFCGECRNLLHIKSSSNIVCPNCGLAYKKHSRGLNESNHYEIQFYHFLNVYYINDLIDSVTINKSFNDDGRIRDINVTILYHSYKVSSDAQSKISWQHYDRILFNFETKQVYYTDKLSLSKKVNFRHFKLYQERVSGLSKFSIMIPSVIKEIYDSYQISCPNKMTWYNSTPTNMQSSVIALMCLKFPVMMKYTYDLWTNYKHRKNTLCVVDMHVSMIYWACNYDRVLKKALTSTTEQEYIERTDKIMHEITSDNNIIKSTRNNPLYVVYARYMHQLGFDSFSSIDRVVNYVSTEGSHNIDTSVWIYDMLCKRTHVRNKMYRRFLKIYPENLVLDMLFNSKIKETYSRFFSGYNHRLNINRFYDALEQQFNSINFSDSIDDIFHDIT